MTPSQLRLVTALDEAIHASDRDLWSRPIVRPATKADLAYLLDLADQRWLALVGLYGNVGAGTTTVSLISEDGAAVEIDELNEDDISAALPEGEPLARALLAAITGWVWNGNNHVAFAPRRSSRFCVEADVETYRWGHVTYHTENGFRGICDTITLPDWVRLVWRDAGGNDLTESPLTAEEADALIEMRPRDIPAGIEEFTDDNNEVLAYYCRRNDAPRIAGMLRQTMRDAIR